jgi:hypothetical protein
VLRLFKLIHERDRKVFGGYAALAVSRNQKFVFTESEFAGAFAGAVKNFSAIGRNFAVFVFISVLFGIAFVVVLVA